MSAIHPERCPADCGDDALFHWPLHAERGRSFGLESIADTGTRIFGLAARVRRDGVIRIATPVLDFAGAVMRDRWSRAEKKTAGDRSA